MIIYIITKGDNCYETICAVAETPQKAEKLKNFFSTKFSSAEIKEYDTNSFKDVLENDYKSYTVTFDSSKVVNSIFECPAETIGSYNWISGSRSKNYSYCVHVLAANRQHARKIADDLMAEYINKL